MPPAKSDAELKIENKGPARSRTHAKGKPKGVDTYTPLVKPEQFPFSREVVIRLIDWVKHI